MKPTSLFISCGFLVFLFAIRLNADQLLMQNGDRYTGRVLSMTEETVVLQNEVLGKVSLPRAKVAGMAFGTNAAVATAPSTTSALTPTNLPNVAALSAMTNNGGNLSATAPNLLANSDLARQIREQFLAGSPEATGKYNELV